MKFSQSDDDGVIGYHAATVQPPMMQPSAAARLPSMKSKPSVSPVIGSRRYASLFFEMFARVLVPDAYRVHIGLDGRRLALELIADTGFDGLFGDIEEIATTPT